MFVAQDSDELGPAGVLVRWLQRMGGERVAPVVIFRHEPGPLALSLQHEGAVVHELGDPERSQRPGFLANTVAVHRLAEMMRELAPAVAHALDAPSSPLVALAGRVAGVPALVGTWNRHGLRASWRAAAAWRRLDAIVVPSEALRAEVAGRLRARHPPLVVAEEGVDPGLLRGRARSPEFSEPRLRVGAILRLEEGSGADDLVEAAALLESRIEDVEWLVSGTGRDALALLRRIQRRGLDSRIRLLGFRDDPGAFLASVDAFVAPGGSDALPIGLLQALAAGVPSIAARNPTLEAAFAEGCDLLFVPAARPDAIADAVARVLGDESRGLRASLAAAGPAAVAAFGEGAAPAAVLELYDSLTSLRQSK